VSEPNRDAEPTVVVDDVHLTYRVTGRHASAGAPAVLKRLVQRKPAPGMREIHAVRGVSLIARRGEAIGLIGPNGSGKSTLLRAIAGLMPPSSGAIYTQGQPSLLGVAAALMNDMTGERNVVLGCMAARLRFAIAATKSHEVLLIDEALATGDAEFRRRSEARIRELREAAGTVFLVSHGLGVVRETCGRAIWLEQGRIVADGEADAVVEAYEARHDPAALEQRLAAAAAGGKLWTTLDEPSSA
jgi:teichoic acid transport system ATP-binding protein